MANPLPPPPLHPLARAANLRKETDKDSGLSESSTPVATATSTVTPAVGHQNTARRLPPRLEPTTAQHASSPGDITGGIPTGALNATHFVPELITTAASPVDPVGRNTPLSFGPTPGSSNPPYEVDPGHASPLAGANIPPNPPSVSFGTSQTRSRASSFTSVDEDERSLLESDRESIESERENAYQREVNEALAELEDLEVHQFLKRVGRRVTEVHVTGGEANKERWAFPKMEEYESTEAEGQDKVGPSGDASAGVSKPKGKKVDWFGFVVAYAIAFAHNYLPPDFLVEPPSKSLEIRHLALTAERIYTVIPQQAIDFVIRGGLGKLYRWEDPLRTGKFAAIYAILWLFDLIPFFLFAFPFYLLVSVRLFPPEPKALLKAIELRKQRGQEAELLSDDLQRQTEMSFLSSKMSGAVGIAGMIGASAISEGVDKVLHHHKGKEKEPDATNAEGVEAVGKAATGSTGIYHMAMNLLKEFGPEVQIWSADIADLAEKMKNCAMWRRPEGTWVTCGILGFISLFLYAVPIRYVIKLVLLWVGVEFFAVLAICEVYPEYRRALNPLWYIFYSCPTDSEYVMDILGKRARENRPLRSSRTIKRIVKKQRAARHSASPSAADKFDTASILSTDSKASIRSAISQIQDDVGGLFRKRRDQAGSNGSSSHLTPAAAYAASTSIERTPTGASETASIAGTEVAPFPIRSYFAVLSSVPGNIILTKDEFLFEAMKGTRHITKAIRFADSSSSPNLSASASAQGTTASRTLVKLDFGKVAGVKKLSGFGFGFEDLEIKLTDKQVLRFANVFHRDECFNTLLSLSPSVWAAGA